eukprot:gene67044-91822_t
MSKMMSGRATLGLGGAALLALGALGGGAVAHMTRPAVEMAPANAVAISSLAQRQGIVTVKGKVAEVYGDRFVIARHRPSSSGWTNRQMTSQRLAELGQRCLRLEKLAIGRPDLVDVAADLDIVMRHFRMGLG